MKKHYPTNTITNELSGASVFFQPQAPLVPELVPATTSPIPQPVPPPPPVSSALDATQESKQPPKHEDLPSPQQDVTHDVITSCLQGIDLKQWREQIENTETQNSSLRLTSEERYIIEDVISALQRQERIKTSMNEVARLGLLFLIHEFKQNGHKSILYRVKKA